MNYIKRIQIQNVHGIRKTLELDFDKHTRRILLYGYNGSGKTSLFRAIGTYLKTVQSPQSIQTIKHRSQLSQSAKITFIVADGTRDHELMWSDYPETYPNHLLLSECAQSLGHLSYNDVLELSFAFRNQHSMDVFPYLQSVVFYHAETQWSRPLSIIQSEIDELVRDNKKVPEKLIKEYNDTLTNVTQKVKELANTYIKEYFCNQKLRIELRKNQDYNVKNKPQVQLTAVLESEQHDDFFKFMNEALVSTIAFALYFASLKLVGKSKLPFLVLDDIHLALDNDSRNHLMNLIETEFAEYQILFMSHDLAYCEYLATNPLWDYRKLINAAHISRHNEDLLANNVMDTYFSSGETTRFLGDLRKELERRLYNSLKTLNPTLEVEFKQYAGQSLVLGSYMKFVRNTLAPNSTDFRESQEKLYKHAKPYLDQAHHYIEKPHVYTKDYIKDLVEYISKYINAVEKDTQSASRSAPTYPRSAPTYPRSTPTSPRSTPTSPRSTPTSPRSTPTSPQKLKVSDLTTGTVLTGHVHIRNEHHGHCKIKIHGMTIWGHLPITKNAEHDNLQPKTQVTVRVTKIDYNYVNQTISEKGSFEVELVSIL